MLINSMLGLVMLILVLEFGYAGHCARLLLMSSTYALATHFVRPLRIRPRFSIGAFNKLLRIGMPLLVQNYLHRVSLSVGPVFLLWLGGTSALGLFAPVNAIFSALAIVPNALMSFVSPQQHYDYGRHGSPELCVKRVATLTAVLMLGAVPFAIVGIFVLPWAVKNLAPQYIESVPAMQVAVVLGLLRIFGVATTAYATLAAWKEMFTNQLSLWLGHALGASFGALLYLAQPWLGVTWGLLLAYIVYIPITLYSLQSLAKRPIQSNSERSSSNLTL